MHPLGATWIACCASYSPQEANSYFDRALADVSSRSESRTPDQKRRRSTTAAGEAVRCGRWGRDSAVQKGLSRETNHDELVG